MRIKTLCLTIVLALTVSAPVLAESRTQLWRELLQAQRWHWSEQVILRAMEDDSSVDDTCHENARKGMRAHDYNLQSINLVLRLLKKRKFAAARKEAGFALDPAHLAFLGGWTKIRENEHLCPPQKK